VSDNPLISVVMTVYNGRKFLAPAIEGVLAQTLRDFELICIDDGSSDDSVEIIESFDDPRIRLIRNSENLGISNSRNIGIEAARGRYMAAHDQDDLSRPTRLEAQARAFDANSRAVMVAVCCQILQGGKLLPARASAPPPHVLAWRLMLRDDFVHSSICLKLDTLRTHDIRYRQTYHYAEDYDLYHQLANHGEIVQVPELLAIYRDHGENTSLLRRDEMRSNGLRFMLDVYRRYLGEDAIDLETIGTIWNITVRTYSAETETILLDTGRMIARLQNAYIKHHGISAEQTEDLRRDGAAWWWRTVAKAALIHGPGILSAFAAVPEFSAYPPKGIARLKTMARTALGPRARTALKTLAGRG